MDGEHFFVFGRKMTTNRSDKRDEYLKFTRNSPVLKILYTLKLFFIKFMCLFAYLVLTSPTFFLI